MVKKEALIVVAVIVVPFALGILLVISTPWLRANGYL